MKLKVNTEKFTIENFFNSNYIKLFELYLGIQVYNKNDVQIFEDITDGTICITFRSDNNFILWLEIKPNGHVDIYEQEDRDIKLWTLNTIEVANWMLENEFYILE